MADCKCACIDFPVDFTENDIDICVEFDDDGDFNALFTDMDLEIPADFDEILEINKAVTDHPDLAKRNLPNQHPIGAITSLDGELAARPSEVLSNIDIFNILSR